MQLAERIAFEDPVCRSTIDLIFWSRRYTRRMLRRGAPPPMLLSLRQGPDGEPDLSAAVEPAISAAVLQGHDAGLWVNAILMAAHGGESDGVVYET